jgi:hypothetical protein
LSIIIEFDLLLKMMVLDLMRKQILEMVMVSRMYKKEFVYVMAPEYGITIDSTKNIGTTVTVEIPFDEEPRR